MHIILAVIAIMAMAIANAAGFDVELAVKAVKNAPRWTEMTEEQIATDGPKLIAVLDGFVDLSPADAREVVKALQVAAGKTDDTDLYGKIYIYNRLYCKVPVTVDQSTWRFFGGWVGVRVFKGSVNALYPLGKRADGRLELSASFGGYMGPLYRGLAEFDFLLKRFGRPSEK